MRVDQGFRVGPRDRAGGGEHADQPRARQGGGRLDGRHGADERDVEMRAQVRQDDVDRGRRVAGDNDEVGPVAGDKAPHEGGDALGEIRLGKAPIGEAGIVGHVDVAGVRARLGDLGMDGQAAEAGIEDEDGRSARGHRDRGVNGSGEKVDTHELMDRRGVRAKKPRSGLMTGVRTSANNPPLEGEGRRRGSEATGRGDTAFRLILNRCHPTPDLRSDPPSPGEGIPIRGVFRRGRLVRLRLGLRGRRGLGPSAHRPRRDASPASRRSSGPYP